MGANAFLQSIRQPPPSLMGGPHLNHPQQHEEWDQIFGQVWRFMIGSEGLALVRYEPYLGSIPWTRP